MQKLGVNVAPQDIFFFFFFFFFFFVCLFFVFFYRFFVFFIGKVSCSLYMIRSVFSQLCI